MTLIAVLRAACAIAPLCANNPVSTFAYHCSGHFANVEIKDHGKTLILVELWISRSFREIAAAT
jgi:hypothetical protein